MHMQAGVRAEVEEMAHDAAAQANLNRGWGVEYQGYRHYIIYEYDQQKCYKACVRKRLCTTVASNGS